MLIEQQRFNAVEGYYCKSEQPLDTVLETGPYKGIRTTSDISEKYAAYLEDLDSIREEYDAAICIVGLQPWQYLYLDLPYGTYSTWFVGADFAERNWQYWLLHPEKTPAFFYLPYYSSYNWEKDEKTFEARQRDLNEMFSLSRTEGKAGYIFYVK
ncbi:MAG: hypothetical protein IJK89_07350 [Clostridia bacterium]|nr:hypothetical protein [Clostridia bacterium]